MTRNNDRDNNVMTDVKLAAASALVTALAIFLANATPASSAESVSVCCGGGGPVSGIPAADCCNAIADGGTGR